MEIWELPWDFVYLLKQVIYEDYTREAISVYSNVPKPPKKVIYDPKKFDRWIKWARNYKPKTGSITPFGQQFEDEDGYYEFWG